MIPNPTYYPDDFDDDTNLYLVHDGLRLKLARDYNPGDKSIFVDIDPIALSRWPSTGLITLTEQCSTIDERAISFFFNGLDAANGVLSNLELLPGFPDVKKPKRVTNVTQNVMAAHHNNLKDALKAIQGFAGVQGTIDNVPFGPTLEGRINFLRKLVLPPRAWFTADKRTGIVPLEVEFKDLSFRLGSDGTANPVTITWDFGDNTTSVVNNISTISTTSVVPDQENIYVIDMDGGKITKTYMRPGFYDVTVTASNKFGSDTCTFPKFINARIPAPDEAVITFVGGDGQTVTPGSPSNGPYAVVPMVRSPINTLIEFDVPPGRNPATGKSYGGEPLNSPSNTPLDPISNYTWHLGDDLNHPNSPVTKASYGVGGIYDLKLRVDTEFGAYRITSYPNCIDIVENYNLWMWLYTDAFNVRSYEYGLLSESFKLNSNTGLFVDRDASFLNGLPDENRQKQEFFRNVGFAPRTTTASGQGGSALIYYASGRSGIQSPAEESIQFTEYSGFTDTYINRPQIDRPWNWASFSSTSTSFFAFGATLTAPGPRTSPTNVTKTALDLVAFTTASTTIASQDFQNGAQELMQNPAVYDTIGDSTYGNYSVYRTAWKDSTGYIARNDGVGPFFRLKSFYRTEGSVSNPFQTIRKLNDIQGPTKLEGELSNMSQGVYFFNNTGSVSAFDDTASTWYTGGPGINSVAYRALQDTTKEGFDDPANTLLCASDGDHKSYLSFDYSTSVLIKFSEIDLTFSTLGARPVGNQFLIGIY